MILSWMIYTSVLTLLLGLAVWSLEGVVRQRNRPVRGLWILALLGSVLLPIVVSAARGPEPRDTALTPATAVATTGPWLGWAAPVTPGGAPGWSPRLSPWLLALWALTSAALLLALILSQRGLLHRRRGWTMQEVDGRTVWVSPDTGPAVIGFRESCIVLPAWVLDASAGERALILAHEEEHVRAGDPRLLMGALLLAVVLPWNLALWWVWRRLRQAAEVDCDLRVLARGADRRAYSRLLVEVADRGNARHVAIVALSESPSFLERRIRLMLNTRPRPWTRVAGPVLLASTLVIAACRMGQPGSPVAERLTLWISPTGTYHLHDLGSGAIPLPKLGEALRTALARTDQPAILDVKVYEGAGGYEYIMARNAACEAGVRRIEFAANLPVAPAKMRGVEEIRLPCPDRTAQADTALARP